MSMDIVIHAGRLPRDHTSAALTRHRDTLSFAITIDVGCDGVRRQAGT